jgi:hypothetical protein
MAHYLSRGFLEKPRKAAGMIDMVMSEHDRFEVTGSQAKGGESSSKGARCLFSRRPTIHERGKRTIKHVTVDRSHWIRGRKRNLIDIAALLFHGHASSVPWHHCGTVRPNFGGARRRTHGILSVPNVAPEGI